MANSGEGYEYVMFADMREVVVGRGDMVGATLKAIWLLNTEVFVATKIQLLRP